MQRRVERRSVPIKTRGSIRAESIAPTPPERKTARTSNRRRCVGAACSRSIRAKEAATHANGRSGIAGAMASPGTTQRDRQALKGTKTSREASDRSWILCEATSLATGSPRNRALDRTGKAGWVRSARKGGRGPVRRSACRRVKTAASQRTPVRRSGNRKIRAAQANTAARFSGSSSTSTQRAGATNDRIGNDRPLTDFVREPLKRRSRTRRTSDSRREKN